MSKNTELQAKLDVRKWVDSEAQGRDTCGDYDFCKFCDKSVEEPCANAYNKKNGEKDAPRKAKAEEKVAAVKVEEVKPVVAEKAEEKAEVKAEEKAEEKAAPVVKATKSTAKSRK